MSIDDCILITWMQCDNCKIWLTKNYQKYKIQFFFSCFFLGGSQAKPPEQKEVFSSTKKAGGYNFIPGVPKNRLKNPMYLFFLMCLDVNQRPPKKSTGGSRWPLRVASFPDCQLTNAVEIIASPNQRQSPGQGFFPVPDGQRFAFRCSTVGKAFPSSFLDHCEGKGRFCCSDIVTCDNLQKMASVFRPQKKIVGYGINILVYEYGFIEETSKSRHCCGLPKIKFGNDKVSDASQIEKQTKTSF